jgi:hypothetical protein
MKRRLVILLVAAVAAFGGATASPALESFTPSASAHSCSSSYVHAHLPWGQKCLRRGQYCKLDGDRYYHRYGFHCHRSGRDSEGDYHLTR